MADYGLILLCTFDPIGPTSATPIYRLEILKKDYSGTAGNVKGGGVPVLHQWQTDDPKAPIKGSSLNITLINEGSLPLTYFYSTDDDEFKVRLYWTDQLLFEGFLVQDDCSETMVDFNHEINLSANDNLGLLKDVALDKSPTNYSIIYTGTTGYFANAPHELWVDSGFAVRVLVGDQIQIGTDFYTVADNSGGNDLVVRETIPTIAATTGSLNLLRSSLLDKISLLTVVKTCIKATGIDLDTYIWGSLNEQSQDTTRSFFEQTFIDPQTFLKTDTDYDDCYTVLTKILGRLKMTFFQALGHWNIMRWDELRYFSNAITGYIYNSDFVLTGPATLSAPFIAGTAEITQAETGLLRKILRPFKFVKETFNFKQPAQIFRNSNLQMLGNLLRTYTEGSGTDQKTISEYEALWFTDAPLSPSVSEFFIRIVYDSLGNEIERYFCARYDNARSYKIEVQAGDSFTLSFRFRTGVSKPGNVNLVFNIELTDGTTTLYFHNPATETPGDMWQSLPGFLYQVPSGDNSQEWHDITVDTSEHPIPFDGLLYINLDGLSSFEGGTWFFSNTTDIRFEYVPRINQSTKIIGQTHTNTQGGGVKQTEDEEIFIDSSPRNSIAGTLFLESFTGVLQDRTKKWEHPYLGEIKNLGELITFEELFWRRKPRTILEGTLYGIVQDSIHASILAVVNYTFLPSLNFVFGTLEIDYKNNKLSGTLWEIWQGTVGIGCKMYSFEYSGFPVEAWSIDGTYCDGTVFNFSSISGDGEIPGPLCARIGSISFVGSIIVTEGASCGDSTGSELDSDLASNYQFKYIYSTK